MGYVKYHSIDMPPRGNAEAMCCATVVTWNSIRSAGLPPINWRGLDNKIVE